MIKPFSEIEPVKGKQLLVQTGPDEWTKVELLTEARDSQGPGQPLLVVGWFAGVVGPGGKYNDGPFCTIEPGHLVEELG